MDIERKTECLLLVISGRHPLRTYYLVKYDFYTD